MFERIQEHRLGRWAAIVLIAASAGVAGCSVDDLLNVEDPETIDESELENASLDVIVTGAQGDFTTAYSGPGGDGFLSVTALMSDEFFSSGTFTTRTNTDRRNQFPPATGNTSDGPYLDLQFARRALGQTADQVAEVEDTSDPRYVELKALEGYTYVALGEGFCSAIPFSARDDDGTFEYGEPQNTQNVFDRAAASFEAALAGAAEGSHLAAIGQGRALLNAGDPAGAAEAVADVPTDYVYHIEHSVFGEDNPIYALQENGRYSVSDEEGENGLAFRTAEDPRAPWWQDPDDETGFDEGIPLYKSLKYRSFDAPVVLASGVEARLIEAEAALPVNGGSGDWLGILNDLREDVFTLMSTHVPGYAQIVLDHGWVDATSDIALDPLSDPGGEAARVDLLFAERGYWLYLTGHRLGDLRRLVQQYDREPQDVYPTGDYHKSGSYGDDVVFPLDFDEANNPLFEHDMCDVDAVD